MLVPRHRRQTPRLIRRRVGVGRRVPHHRRVEKRAKSEARRPLRAPCFPQTTCPCAQVTSPPPLPLQPPSQGAKPAPPNRQHVLTPFTTSIHSPCTHAHPPASGQTSTKPPVHASACSTCRRRRVARTCRAGSPSRRLLVRSRLARRARAAVGPRVSGDALAVSAGVASCIHVRTDAHTHRWTQADTHA